MRNLIFDKEINNWLMKGDPTIRWQVMRDLLDSPQAEYEAERKKDANWPKNRVSLHQHFPQEPTQTRSVSINLRSSPLLRQR